MLRECLLAGVVTLALTGAVILQPKFFDPFAMLLTCGGALTVTCFSYTRMQLRNCVYAIGAVLARKRTSVQQHSEELRRLTELFRLQGLRGLECQEGYLRDPYLRYGLALLLDLNREEKIRARMEHRLMAVRAEHEINRQILMTLGKLLPSFGLIGTLIGMVLLLGNLSGLDSKGLPAALGLSVLTTLYGAVFANVVVAPVLARLDSAAVEQAIQMNLTKDWVLMIAGGDSTLTADRGRRPLLDFEPQRSRLWESMGIAPQK